MSKPQEEELPAREVQALVKQAEKKFKEAIDVLRTRRESIAINLVQWSYDVGILASNITDDRSKALHERTYGAHVVEDVSSRLEQKAAVVYVCMQFSAKFSKQEAKYLQSKKWPWRGIVSLITVENKKDRDKFQKGWEDGKYSNTDALKAAIAEYNDKSIKIPGIRKETRGSKSPVLVPVKTADAVMTKFTGDTLPGLLKALGAAKDADLEEGSRETVQDRLDHIREMIPPVKQMLIDAEKAIKVAGF